LLAAGVAALAVIPAASGSAAARKAKQVVVKVGDDYYSPAKPKVARGTTVVWKWLAVNGNSHDVELKSGPKGVKKFHSASAAASFSFKRKLTVKGTYSIICTFHQDMTMSVVVR
jgi:plastocyanin